MIQLEKLRRNLTRNDGLSFPSETDFSEKDADTGTIRGLDGI